MRFIDAFGDHVLAKNILKYGEKMGGPKTRLWGSGGHYMGLNFWVFFKSMASDMQNN